MAARRARTGPRGRPVSAVPFFPFRDRETIPPSGDDSVYAGHLADRTSEGRPAHGPNATGRPHKEVPPRDSIMTTLQDPGLRRSSAVAERSRLRAEYDRQIDQLAAEFHARLPRERAQAVAAIYARYSSQKQDSIVDQVRTLFEFAVAQRIFVPRDFVCFDAGIRGAKDRRPDLDRLRSILAGESVDVLLVFSTNRLFRKTYKALQFIEEEVVERGIRCVFVKAGVDTADRNRWQTLLHIHAMQDEFVGGMYADNIRAAHEGLFDGGMVCGTIPFGYRGVECPDQMSRRHRPRRAMEIDPAAARWVEQAFSWYAVEGLSIGAIVCRFNGDPAIPRSPRGRDGRWSRDAIRYLLANPRYRGWWEYGVRENIFLSKKDYTRRVPRDQPIRQAQFEELRIISDELWSRAERRLARPDRSAVGRKPRRGDPRSRPRLIHGLFVCPTHDQILYVGGNYGQTLFCRSCSQLPAADRPLYSHLPRALAVKLTCRKLAELLRQDDGLVGAVIDACRRAADEFQRPDPDRLEDLRSRIGALDRQIRFIMEDAGPTADDRRESRVALDEARRRRAGLKAELAELESARSRTAVVPTEAEVRDELARLESTLAVEPAGEEESGEVRQVIDLLTGGRIEVFQCGERRSHGGWLRGQFRARVIEGLALKLCGAACGELAGAPIVTIDYREPTPSEAWADRVKELYDGGMLINKIAAELGITRNLAAKALDAWYERAGLPRPDGRSRRSTPELKHLGPPLFISLSEEARRLHDAGHGHEEIADRLRCSRQTAVDAVRHWYQSRDLPVPSTRRIRDGADGDRPWPTPRATGEVEAASVAE